MAKAYYKTKEAAKKIIRGCQLRLNGFRRLTPFSRVFGLDRGLSIDRYYIEKFLSRNSRDIQGRVLELADNEYTLKFGGKKVTRSDILHLTPDNPKATLIADLTSGEGLPSETFDCIICTQTLQFIYDCRAAIKSLHRILKPQGVLLVTFPGISQISRYDMERWGEYWRFTSLSARKLFEERFPADQIGMELYGNVLSAVAFLHGVAAEELKPKELDFHDPDYELLIAMRARKPDPLL